MRLNEEDLLSYGDYKLFRAMLDGIGPHLTHGAYFGPVTLYKSWYTSSTIFKGGHVTEISFNFPRGMIAIGWWPGFSIQIADPNCVEMIIGKINAALAVYYEHTPSARE